MSKERCQKCGHDLPRWHRFPAKDVRDEWPKRARCICIHPGCRCEYWIELTEIQAAVERVIDDMEDQFP